MNVNLFRCIDKYIGMPLCFFFTVIDRLFKFFFKSFFIIKPNTHKIIFLKPSEKGATVLAGPALKKAVEKYGYKNVYFLTFYENRHILALMGLIPEKNIITIPAKSIYSIFFGTLRAIRLMWKIKFYYVVDFEFFSRYTALIAWLSRARIRAGYHSYSTEFGYRGDFFTHKLVYTGRGHQSEIYMNIFNALDCNKNDFPALKKESLDLNLNDIKVNDNDIKVNDVVTYKYRPFKCDVDRLKKKLNKIGVIVNKKIKIVLINSNCGDIIPLRKWPEDKYIKVTEMLLNKFSDLTVIYTGDKSEITRTQSIVSRINSKNCISMAGLLDLKEFIILISLSNLLLTNDSGPAHFCSLTDTPSLVLFGPESPHRFGPFGANVNVIWLDMPCSPCVNAFNNRVSECSNNLCMKDINAKMVFNKIVNILK